MGYWPKPFDPMCERWAEDMVGLDYSIYESEEELRKAEAAGDKEIKRKRREYVRLNEGTYNFTNGHFLCDECYIKAGMPSSDRGWRCP